MERVWYYCTGCEVVLSKGEARVFGCGNSLCVGKMHWLEMTEQEHEGYGELLEEIGIKEFAKRVRYKELQ